MKYALLVPLRYLVAVLLFAAFFLVLSAAVSFTSVGEFRLTPMLSTTLPVAVCAAAILSGYLQLFSIVRAPAPAFRALVLLFFVTALALSGVSALGFGDIVGHPEDAPTEDAVLALPPTLEHRLLEYPRFRVYLAAIEDGVAHGALVLRLEDTPRFRLYREARALRPPAIGASRLARRGGRFELKEDQALLDPAGAENLHGRYFAHPPVLHRAVQGFETLSNGLLRRAVPWGLIDSLAIAFAVVSAISLARMTRWPPLNLILTAISATVVLSIYAFAQQPYPGELLAVFELEGHAPLVGPIALTVFAVVQLALLIPQRPLDSWRQELGYA